jgi:DNA-binding MltR family transcriptional regulator
MIAFVFWFAAATETLQQQQRQQQQQKLPSVLVLYILRICFSLSLGFI